MEGGGGGEKVAAGIDQHFYLNYIYLINHLCILCVIKLFSLNHLHIILICSLVVPPKEREIRQSKFRVIRKER